MEQEWLPSSDEEGMCWRSQHGGGLRGVPRNHQALRTGLENCACEMYDWRFARLAIGTTPALA